MSGDRMWDCDKMQTIRMIKWTPEAEVSVKKRLGGWVLQTTGPCEAYILQIDGEDLLHIHVEGEGEIFVATPRNVMRKYLPE